MSLNNEGSSASKILFSVLAAMALLAGASVLFITWAVPAYGIDIAVVYSVLTRLFPILIGLILMQIGIILASPSSSDKTDPADILVKDDYDDPLYALPNEDPALKTTAASSYLEPVPHSPLETIASPATAPAAELPGPPTAATISTFIPVKPSVIEPIEDDKIIPEPKITSLGLAPLTQAVLFKDYPYPIRQDSEIADLLSPLPETEAIDDPALLVHQTIIEDTFGNRLDSEIASAQENQYGLSLGVINLPDLNTDPQDLEAGISQTIFQKLDSMSFFYVLDEHRIAVILPFYRFTQAKRFFASLLENLRKGFPDSSVQIGFSSLNERMISKENLFQEVEIATSWAKEQQGFSLIGYESESEAPEST